jgi:competence protein ComEC
MIRKDNKKNFKRTNRPFLFIGFFFVIGIIIAHFISVNSCLLYGLILGVYVLCIGFINKRFFCLIFLLLCFLLGGLRYNVASFVANDNIGNLVKSQKDVEVIGHITKAPAYSKDRWGRNRCSFVFQVERLSDNGCFKTASGQIKIYSLSHFNELLQYGYAYVLEGNFKPASLSIYEKSKSYQTYLKSRHIDGFFYMNKRDAIIKLTEKKAKINILYLGSLKLREKLITKYKQLFNEPYNSLLAALVLGQRTDMNEDIFNSFISSGTVHVLAISGLHIGIIVIFFISIGKLFGLSRTQASIICIGFLVFYCFLSGARVSVVRASIMASIILGGWVVKRDSDIYNSLGLAAVLILVTNPYYLFDIGFQLSFISVLSIVYLYPKMSSWFTFLFKGNNKRITKKIIKYFLDAICVSLAASIAVAPLSLYYFKQVSTIGVITNLIMLPLLSLVLILAVIVSILSFIYMPVARIFAETLWLFLSLMIKTAQEFGNIDFAVFRFEDFNIIHIILFYVLLGFGVHIGIIYKSIKMRLLKSRIE